MGLNPLVKSAMHLRMLNTEQIIEKKCSNMARNIVRFTKKKEGNILVKGVANIPKKNCITIGRNAMRTISKLVGNTIGRTVKNIEGAIKKGKRVTVKS